MSGYCTFNNAGRLGNWLFEAATCVGYSIKHNLQFSFPKHTQHPFHCPVYMIEYNKPDYNPNLGEVRLYENKHSYEELPFKEEWRYDYNIIIEGYRQTSRYFQHCEDYIKKLFHPNWGVFENVVGVHVRRTDYLALKEKHPYVSENWYKEAMTNFDGCKFIFFSDDIRFCKEHFGNQSNCYFSEGRSEWEDLMALACCQHQINSSSTFSWWGAYLGRNDDKIVYTPEQWFTPNWMNLNTNDIVPDNWIKLPNK